MPCLSTCVQIAELYDRLSLHRQGPVRGLNAIGRPRHALFSNTTGSANTASGVFALDPNTTGSNNTAVGYAAGWVADDSPITSSFNTAIGTATKFGTGSLTNATAIGANAEVDNSNALVLGSINGVNGATANVDVGIGTTTPDAQLNLGGGQWDLKNTEGDLKIGNDSYRLKMGVALAGSGAGDSRIRAFGGTNRLILGSGPDDVLTISGNNVGIGTLAPDNNLSVNGSADKPGGGSWGTFSDRRLKILSGNFQPGLNQILQLHPVRYRYKQGNEMGIHDRDEHIGLVAQDVQKVIPEAVTENSKGYLLLNNDPILWAMLNAIKEQQAQIHQQQDQIRVQQAQIARLTRQVRVIQTSLNTNGRTGAEVRTVKAKMPVAQQ